MRERAFSRQGKYIEKREEGIKLKQERDNGLKEGWKRRYVERKEQRRKTEDKGRKVLSQRAGEQVDAGERRVDRSEGSRSMTLVLLKEGTRKRHKRR